MGMTEFTSSLLSDTYSRKLAARICAPRNGGFFSHTDAIERRMQLVKGIAGTVEEGNSVRLYWLVDPEDGIIVDARFQVFGHPALIGAADIACDVLVRGNYRSVSRIDAGVIDKHARDHHGVLAFPKEVRPYVDQVISAIEDAAERYREASLGADVVREAAFTSDQRDLEGYVDFEQLSHEEKLAVIEGVLDEEIRPFIALDGGGVKVVDLVNDYALLVAYEGACVSCVSATGATLSYIKGVLCDKVHPNLEVIPDFSE